jgi:hypothetical protein
MSAESKPKPIRKPDKPEEVEQEIRQVRGLMRDFDLTEQQVRADTRIRQLLKGILYAHFHAEDVRRGNWDHSAPIRDLPDLDDYLGRFGLSEDDLDNPTFQELLEAKMRSDAKIAALKQSQI